MDSSGGMDSSGATTTTSSAGLSSSGLAWTLTIPAKASAATVTTDAISAGTVRREPAGFRGCGDSSITCTLAGGLFQGVEVRLGRNGGRPPCEGHEVQVRLVRCGSFMASWAKRGSQRDLTLAA